MIDSDTQRWLRREIQRQINIILSGEAGSTTATTETIQNMFPGQDGILDRPVMHPYGFGSRAPKGTISVVARQGEHPANRVVLGHRAADRPAMDEGESVLYSKSGYQVRVKNGVIEIGKGGAFEPVVLGDKLTALLEALIDAIAQHTHIGNLGAPTGPPQNASTFNQLKSNQVSGDKLLSKDGGGF